MKMHIMSIIRKIQNNSVKRTQCCSEEGLLVSFASAGQDSLNTAWDHMKAAFCLRVSSSWVNNRSAVQTLKCE